MRSSSTNDVPGVDRPSNGLGDVSAFVVRDLPACFIDCGDEPDPKMHDFFSDPDPHDGTCFRSDERAHCWPLSKTLETPIVSPELQAKNAFLRATCMGRALPVCVAEAMASSYELQDNARSTVSVLQVGDTSHWGDRHKVVVVKSVPWQADCMVEVEVYSVLQRMPIGGAGKRRQQRRLGKGPTVRVTQMLSWAKVNDRLVMVLEYAGKDLEHRLEDALKFSAMLYKRAEEDYRQCSADLVSSSSSSNAGALQLGMAKALATAAVARMHVPLAVVRAGLHMALALQAMHVQRVVLQDAKLNNLCYDADTRTISVIDVEACVCLPSLAGGSSGADAQALDTLVPKHVLATPGYSAPEQQPQPSGEAGYVSTKTDVFALGAGAERALRLAQWWQFATPWEHPGGGAACTLAGSSEPCDAGPLCVAMQLHILAGVQAERTVQRLSCISLQCCAHEWQARPDASAVVQQLQELQQQLQESLDFATQLT